MTLFPYDRPASIGEVLDAAFLLFKRTLPVCLPWSLLAVLLGNLPSVYLLGSGQSLSFLVAKDLVWWGLMAGAATFGLWVWILVLSRQLAVATGRRPGLFDGLADAARSTPRALGVVLLGLLGLLLGTLLLVLPGLYLSVALWPSLTVMVAERLGVVATLDRSLQLVRRNWLHVATTLSVASGIVMALYVAGVLVGIMFAQLEGGIDRSSATLVLGIVTGLLAATFQPLFIALGIAQYLDLLRHPRAAPLRSSTQPA